MKSAIKLLFLCLFFPVNTEMQASKKGIIIAACSISISAASIYGLYRWLRSKESFKPSILNLNTYTITQYPKFTQDNKLSNQKNKNIFDASDTNIETMDIDTLVTRINKNKAPKTAIISPAAADQTSQALLDHDRPPFSTPSLKPSYYLNKKIVAHKGIKSCPNSPLIFIFSRGYARTNTPGTNDNALQKGGCAKAAYIPIQDGVINDAPCVTFDYPDRRRCFNFGQKKDLACLKFIYEETLKKNPQAEIIFIGDCRGAKAILNFTAYKPEKVKALVLLSPFFSAKQLTEEVARNYLSWLPGSAPFLQQLFKVWFPSYDPNGDNNFTKNSSLIDQKMPIFIAHRTHDTLVSTKQVTDFVQTLQKTGHRNIRLVTTNDTSARHSRLTPIKKIQYEANKFFSEYQLPYNADLLSS